MALSLKPGHLVHTWSFTGSMTSVPEIRTDVSLLFDVYRQRLFVIVHLRCVVEAEDGVPRRVDALVT